MKKLLPLLIVLLLNAALTASANTGDGETVKINQTTGAPVDANGGKLVYGLGVPYNQVIAESASFTITTAQRGALFNVTTGSSALTATLPAAATAGNGFTFFVRKTDSGTGSVTVNGSLIGVQGHLLELVSDGTSWYNRAFFGGTDSSGNITITAPPNASLNLVTSGTGSAKVNGTAIVPFPTLTGIPYQSGSPSTATAATPQQLPALTNVSIADANTTLTIKGNSIMVPSATPSAVRTYTLPAASSVAAGQPIYLVDTEGKGDVSTFSGYFGYNLTPVGSDTINGGSTYLIHLNPYSFQLLFSDGVSKWTVATPNQVSSYRGGGGPYYPTISPYNDGTTGIGWYGTAGNERFDWIFGGNNYAAMYQGEFDPPRTVKLNYDNAVYPTTGQDLGNSGYEASNALDWGGTDMSMTDSYQDNWGRILCGGIARLSFYAPHNVITQSGAAYFGDPFNITHTFDLGVGKFGTVQGVDATGVVQTDTNFVQTGNQMNAFSGPVQIGSTGSPVKALYQATTTISGSLTSGSNTSFTVSVNGVSATGDGLVVPRWSGALPAGVSVSQCYVSAANQVTVILHNNNGSTTTLPSTTLGVVEMEF